MTRRIERRRFSPEQIEKMVKAGWGENIIKVETNPLTGKWYVNCSADGEQIARNPRKPTKESGATAQPIAECPKCGTTLRSFQKQK